MSFTKLSSVLLWSAATLLASVAAEDTAPVSFCGGGPGGDPNSCQNAINKIDWNQQYGTGTDINAGDCQIKILSPVGLVEPQFVNGRDFGTQATDILTQGRYGDDRNHDSRVNVSGLTTESGGAQRYPSKASAHNSPAK
jgi:hypothetical protein